VKFKSEIVGKNAVMEGMMPDSIIFLFKNKDVRIILIGGIVSAMMGDIISIGDSNTSYMIDKTDKTAYRYDPYKFEKDIAADIDETGKSQKFMDKKCDLFKVSYTTKNGRIVSDFWITNEVPVSIPKNNPFGKNFTFKGIDGFPLFIQSKINYQSSEFDFIIKCVQIKERQIPDDEFKIPADYKIVPLVAPADIGF
jgi:hypothetical protein